MCACCSKQRRKRLSPSSILAQNPVLLGGVGDRSEQVNLRFTLNMLELVSSPTVKGARPPGYVFSPFAVQASFGVCMLGAHDSTLVDMIRTFFPQSGSVTYAEDVIKEMINSTETARRENHLRLFLRVYANSRVRYSKEFRDKVVEHFHQDPFVPIDYRQTNGESMAATTHQWLAATTRGQLDQFFSTTWRPIDARRSSLCVVSACTMRARFVHPFARHRTRPRAFFTAFGKSTEIDTMRQLEWFGYFATEKLQVIRLEYESTPKAESTPMAEGAPMIVSTMALYLFLPRSVIGLEKMMKELTVDGLLAMCEATKNRKAWLEVFLPTFKMECELDESLIVALSNMGMVDPFKQGRADFSHIQHESVSNLNRLWISGVVHKSLVEIVDEADSSTPSLSVMISGDTDSDPDSGQGGGAQQFVADHPFFFMITHESKTMTPVFVGRFCGL